MISGLVSTIIPVYNRAAMLREAVDSVLRQTYEPVEVIVVDDGSIDGTLEAANAIAEEHPALVRVLTQRNGGPGAARNLGLAHARGEFIQYLDSDDTIEPKKFELQVAALREHSEAGVAYGLTRRVDAETGAVREWARTGDDIPNLFPGFLMQRGWDTNSPLWRRAACDAIGPWSDFRCLEDWEHDLRAGLLGVKPVRVPHHVATVRDHAGQRASGMRTGFTPELTREFFRAHRAVWRRMRDAKQLDWTFMSDFSRKLFWIARMCGERGLIKEADEALRIAREISSGRRSGELRAFLVTTRLIGWKRTVMLAEGVRKLLRRKRNDI
jgi:glycosyltransferase involved in cell wall biosynthesis